MGRCLHTKMIQTLMLMAGGSRFVCKGGNSPLDQLAVVLEAGGHINMPGFALPEDAASRLWLHLHRREHKDRITHLILDQFEEIFTLGSELPGADAEVSQALAILVQGAIPPPVETLLDEGETFLETIPPRRATAARSPERAAGLCLRVEPLAQPPAPARPKLFRTASPARPVPAWKT